MTTKGFANHTVAAKTSFLNTEELLYSAPQFRKRKKNHIDNPITQSKH